MKPISSTLGCPSCRLPLRPKLLACDACGIKVEGPFELNEFATLSAEDLHLLRTFVRTEGRIRDMEAPLGLSYPTIRARLRDLRDRLGAEPVAAAPSAPAPAAAAQIVDRLSKGELSFDEAMSLMRQGGARKERP